jgi:hypothetical protein
MSKSIAINKIQINYRIERYKIQNKKNKILNSKNKKNRKISKHKKHLSNQKMKYLTQFNNHPNILAMKSSNPYY